MELKLEIYVSGHKSLIRGKEKILVKLENILGSLMKLGGGFGGFEEA